MHLKSNEINIVLRGDFWRKYNLIPINTENRPLFPEYQKPFTLKFKDKVITTYVSGKHKISCPEGKYCSKNITEFYRHFPLLKEGDIITIRVIKPMTEYEVISPK